MLLESYMNWMKQRNCDGKIFGSIIRTCLHRNCYLLSFPTKLSSRMDSYENNFPLNFLWTKRTCRKKNPLQTLSSNFPLKFLQSKGGLTVLWTRVLTWPLMSRSQNGIGCFFGLSGVTLGHWLKHFTGLHGSDDKEARPPAPLSTAHRRWVFCTYC
jgi:hypothetical protein